MYRNFDRIQRVYPEIVDFDGIFEVVRPEESSSVPKSESPKRKGKIVATAFGIAAFLSMARERSVSDTAAQRSETAHTCLQKVSGSRELNTADFECLLGGDNGRSIGEPAAARLETREDLSNYRREQSSEPLIDLSDAARLTIFIWAGLSTAGVLTAKLYDSYGRQFLERPLAEQ